MALLAENKRKVKYGIDPRNTNWSNDDSKFGSKLMEKMGWSKGKGLGANEDGRTDHIKASGKSDSRGLGCTLKDADAWIAHQDDYNDLLKNLNADLPTESEDVKPKDTMKRYYGRFACRGQLQMTRSTEDLKQVMGVRAGQEKSSSESSSSSDDDDDEGTPKKVKVKKVNSHGLTTTVSTDSVQTYFAKKMAEKKAKLGLNGNTSLTTETNKFEFGKTPGSFGTVAFSYDDESKDNKSEWDGSNDYVESSDKSRGWYGKFNESTENETKETDLDSSKAKKKKKKKSKEREEEKDEEVLVEETKKDKKKKSKEKEEEKDEEVVVEETKKDKKKKRKNRESNDDSVVEEEPKKKKIKLNGSVLEDVKDSSDESEKIEKKKKKKKKKNSKDEVDCEPEQNKTIEEGDGSEAKKKEKRRVSFGANTIREFTTTDSDKEESESSEEDVPKKKKKKQPESKIESESSEEDVPKKKKKKQPESKIESESSEEDVPKKKKKKQPESKIESDKKTESNNEDDSKTQIEDVSSVKTKQKKSTSKKIDKSEEKKKEKVDPNSVEMEVQTAFKGSNVAAIDGYGPKKEVAKETEVPTKKSKKKKKRSKKT